MSLGLLILNSCTNYKTVNISDIIKRIDVYNAKGEITKSYHKKLNLNTNNWYEINCLIVDEINNIAEKCEFTSLAINQIKYDLKSNNEKDLSLNKTQSSSSAKNEQQKSEKNQKKEDTNNIIPPMNNCYDDSDGC